MARSARHIESFPIRAFECDLHDRLLPRTFCLLLQEAAAAHAAELGVAVDGLVERGVAWVLSQLKLEILRWPRAGDTLVSQSAPAGGGELPIVLHRLLRVADGVEAARARTVWRARAVERC